MNEDGSPFGEAKGTVLHPGESFHGYMIEKQIGQGGLGSIWLGRHHMLETLFAIKALDPDVRTFNDKVSPELAAVLARMCAKKRENRLASPKAVVDAFVRLGYAAPSASETEFAAEPDVAFEDMMQDILSDTPATPRGDENFALETQDQDVQDFLARRKRKQNGLPNSLGASQISRVDHGLAYYGPHSTLTAYMPDPVAVPCLRDSASSSSCRLRPGST